MGILDGLWHLLSFLGPALGMGATSALLAKLLWWRSLRGIGWLRLAAFAILGATFALVAGLIWTGQDGKVATYAAMVLACAMGLACAGWGGWQSRA